MCQGRWSVIRGGGGDRRPSEINVRTLPYGFGQVSAFCFAFARRPFDFLAVCSMRSPVVFGSLAFAPLKSPPHYEHRPLGRGRPIRLIQDSVAAHVHNLVGRWLRISSRGPSCIRTRVIPWPRSRIKRRRLHQIAIFFLLRNIPYA